MKCFIISTKNKLQHSKIQRELYCFNNCLNGELKFCFVLFHLLSVIWEIILVEVNSTHDLFFSNMTYSAFYPVCPWYKYQALKMKINFILKHLIGRASRNQTYKILLKTWHADYRCLRLGSSRVSSVLTIWALHSKNVLNEPVLPAVPSLARCRRACTLCLKHPSPSARRRAG